MYYLTSSGDGSVYGWGNNEYGQVGVASNGEQLGEPVPLNLSELDGRIISMATGGAFTAFLTGNVDLNLAVETFRVEMALSIVSLFSLCAWLKV